VAHCLVLHASRGTLKASEASFVEIVHTANVWIRGCRHNIIRILDPDDYGDDYGGDEIRELLHEMGYPPPQAFLDAAPGAAMFGMKTSIAQHRRLMMQLLTAEERAEVVTPADIEALRACQRAGWEGHYDWVEGNGAFLPEATSYCGSGGSWVAWALDGIEAALYHVAWRGVPLSSPVPALLEPWQQAEWEENTEEIPFIPLSEWLTDHRGWLGDAVIALFHRARAEVVEATLTAGLAPLASDGSSFKAARGEGGMRTRAGARKEALANLRDVVRGEPGLVKLIASFA
jgi:hypothetical protein